MRHRRLRAVLDFLPECYAARTLNGFATHVIEQLPKIISSDLTVYGELNVPRGHFRLVGSPDDGYIFSPKFMQVFGQHFHKHPFAQHYRGSGDGRAVTISDFLSDRQFRQLGLYQDIYRRIALDREMVIWLPAPEPAEITFAVHRKGRDFRSEDRALFNLLRLHLGQAHRNAQAFTRFQQAPDDSRRQAVMVLGAAGRIRFADSLAQSWITDHFESPGTRLPEALDRWVRHLQTFPARKADVPMPFTPLVSERGERSLMVRLFRAQAESILLLEESPTQISSAALEQLGLSRREAEVLRWIAEGKTNAAIASILGISHHTVARHVERILSKLGAETRTAAAFVPLSACRSDATLLQDDRDALSRRQRE